ncbi:MAG: hypothetical protein WC091_01185 [Sulfuricellaceae bacterium]
MSFIALDSLAEARLDEANQVARLLRQVGSVADIDEAERAQKAVPAAFLSPLEDRPLRLSLDDEFVRDDLVYVRVIMLVSNRPADKKGGALIAVRNFVGESLVGWTPPGCNEPLFWVGGGLLKVSGAALWWHDDFVMRRSVFIKD